MAQCASASSSARARQGSWIRAGGTRLGRNGPWAFGAGHHRNVHGMAAPTRFCATRSGRGRPRDRVDRVLVEREGVRDGRRAVAARRCDAAVVAGIDSLTLSTLRASARCSCCRSDRAGRSAPTATASRSATAGFALLEA
jgi:hypothetical protein